MHRFLFLFLLLLCVGVAARGSAAPGGPAAPKIGIVSAIGDKLHLRKVGITVFGNESTEMAIDSWRLDDLIIGKVRAALSGRFDVRAVTYQRAPFAALGEDKEIFFRERRPELVRTGVSPHGLDDYLVITKSRWPYANSNQELLGLGVVESGSTLFGTRVHAYANYALGMVDGRSFTVSDETKAFLPARYLSEIGGVSRKVDNSLWPASAP